MPKPSKSTPTVPQRESRLLKDLKPYPRQREVFDALPAEELRQLANNIKTQGLLHPIDILPDGTILGGHNRVRAVELLGWTEIPVIVRYDLAGKSDAELDEVFIADNLNRRQMDALQIARAYRALKGKCLPRDRSTQRGDLRDQLAKRFGKSGRMLDRYVRCLALPVELQTAVSRRELTLQQGERLLKLSAAELEHIAAAYARGERLRSLLPQDRRTGDTGQLTGMEINRFQARIQQQVLQHRQAPLPLSKSQRTTLQQIQKLIDDLLKAAGRT